MADANDNNDGKALVSYTVKELLAAQNETLARIEGKVDQKVNREDFVRLQTSVTGFQTELNDVKTDIAERHGEEEHGRRVWATAGVVGSILAVFGSGLLGALVVK